MSKLRVSHRRACSHFGWDKHEEFLQAKIENVTNSVSHTKLL